MNDLDQRIRAALAAEENGTASVAEPSFNQEMLDAFKGRYRWLTAWLMLWSLVFLGLAVWCSVRFFQAEEVQLQLQWGAGALVFILGVAFMKIWFWLEMQTNRVLREMKRVELLLVSFIEKSGT